MVSEWHVTYTIFNSDPSFKWQCGSDFYHTQKDAWERAKSQARKTRGKAYLHRKDGAVKVRHDYGK